MSAIGSSKLNDDARQALPTEQEVNDAFHGMRNDVPGAIVQFTSLPKQKSLAEYANTKGIPCVFHGVDGQPVHGILVEWDHDDFFRVIGMNRDHFETAMYRAEDLYEMPENSKLRGAVEFCRANEGEVADSRSQVGSMLKTITEYEQKKAA